MPKIDLHFPTHVIGHDTTTSMQAGILYGAVDALEGMVERIQGEIRKREGKDAIVIATGGFSLLMASRSRVIAKCVPSLVLDGVRLIHERTKKRKSRS